MIIAALSIFPHSRLITWSDGITRLIYFGYQITVGDRECLLHPASKSVSKYIAFHWKKWIEWCRWLKSNVTHRYFKNGKPPDSPFNSCIIMKFYFLLLVFFAGFSGSRLSLIHDNSLCMEKKVVRKGSPSRPSQKCNPFFTCFLVYQTAMQDEGELLPLFSPSSFSCCGTATAVLRLLQMFVCVNEWVRGKRELIQRRFFLWGDKTICYFFWNR